MYEIIDRSQDTPSPLTPFDDPDVPHMWYDQWGRPVKSLPQERIDNIVIHDPHLEPLDPDHPEGPFRVVE